MYKNKYLKYKNKYLKLKKQLYGGMYMDGEGEAVIGPQVYIRINGQNMTLESYQELNGQELEDYHAGAYVPQQDIRSDLYNITLNERLNQRFILQSIYNENDDNFLNIYHIIDPRNDEVRIVKRIETPLEYDDQSVNEAEDLFIHDDIETTYPIFKILEQIDQDTDIINAQRFVEIYNLLLNNNITLFWYDQELITDEHNTNPLDYFINIMKNHRYWIVNTVSCINLNSIKNFIIVLLLNIKDQINIQDQIQPVSNLYSQVFNTIKTGIEQILDSYLEIVVANINIILDDNQRIDRTVNDTNLQIFSDVLDNLVEEYKYYIKKIDEITSENNTDEWDRLNIHVNSIYTSELEDTIKIKIDKIDENIDHNMSIIRERIDSNNAQVNDEHKLLQLEQERDRLYIFKDQLKDNIEDNLQPYILK